QVHRASQAWIGSGATWNTYDYVNPWAAVGGDFDPTVVTTEAFTMNSATPTTPGVFGYIPLTVTPLVQQWVSGTYPNDGFLLKQDTEAGNNYVFFRTTDYFNTAQRPELIITYSVPTGSWDTP